MTSGSTPGRYGFRPSTKQRASLRRLLLSVAFAAVAGAADSSVTEENAATFYRDFVRLTKQPHYVAPLTARLCTTRPSPETDEREKQMTGPLYLARVHLYA